MNLNLQFFLMRSINNVYQLNYLQVLLQEERVILTDQIIWLRGRSIFDIISDKIAGATCIIYFDVVES